MNQMMKFENALTMSSREIASLVDSRHDDVKRSIERLAEKGAITLPPMAEVSNDGPGPKFIKEYRLGKRESLIVVAQLCPEFLARIVDRWQELEELAASAKFLIPQTLPEALRLAADLADQRDQAVARLMIAAPKVEAFNRIAGADGSLCLTDAAKELQVRPKQLIAYLSSHHWIYKRAGCASWIGYQDKIQVGLLEHKSSIVIDAEGRERVRDQVRITGKGLARLAQIFSNTAQAELFAA